MCVRGGGGTARDDGGRQGVAEDGRGLNGTVSIRFLSLSNVSFSSLLCLFYSSRVPSRSFISFVPMYFL